MDTERLLSCLWEPLPPTPRFVTAEHTPNVHAGTDVDGEAVFTWPSGEQTGQREIGPNEQQGKGTEASGGSERQKTAGTLWLRGKLGTLDTLDTLGTLGTLDREERRPRVKQARELMGNWKQLWGSGGFFRL